MELRHLRYFVTVAEERHITRAARRLGIQQPPLSQQIRALEAELGVALFDRNPRGVTLTTAGESLMRDARDILTAVDRAAAAAQRAGRGQSGRLAVGFTTSAMLHPLVPRIIRAFRDAFEAVELVLGEEDAATLTQAVLDGEMQAALLREPVSRPPEISFQELALEEILVVLPSGHRLLSSDAGTGVTLPDLAADRFILVRRPGAAGIYANVIRACRGAGFEPLIAAEVPRMLSAVNLVAAGVGISFVPASMRPVGGSLVGYRRLVATPAIMAPLTLAWPRDDKDPILANFVSVTRQEAASEPKAV